MIEVKLQFATEAELVAFFTRTAGANVAQTAPAVVPTPAPVVETPAAKPKAEAKKAVPSPEPATSPSPAPATTAPAAQAEPAATVAPTPAKLPTYEKSGIPAAVPAYLGASSSEGYMARRQTIVDLLAAFGVKKGPDLKPTQFAEFLAKVQALTELKGG